MLIASGSVGRTSLRWRIATIIVIAASVTGVTVAGGAPARAAAQSGAIVSADACTANNLAANDDSSSSQVALPFTLNFYGRNYNSLWVNNNGNVTFTGPLSTFTPFGLIAANTPIIAPFFADVDTRGNGSNPVQYGYGSTVYEGRPAFCVNWVDVGYYPLATNKLNSFQLLLVDRSDLAPGAFDTVFNYDKVQWESGGASGGVDGSGGTPARAGFANGSDEAGASVELDGSGTRGAFLDSAASGLIHHHEGSNVDGRYLYKVRDGQVLANNYVALGDSFQSGEGAYDYDPNTARSGNYCHRSNNAYPELLVKRGQVNLNLDFRACSGALIEQLSTKTANTNAPPYDEGAQLDALGTDTKLVTIGIAGNDAGFADIVQKCVIADSISTWLLGPLSFIGSSCKDLLSDTVDSSIDSLDHGKIQKKLVELYHDIRKKAPYARVVVVGYPRFFNLDGGRLMHLCEGVRVQAAQMLNDAVIQADGAIGVAAVRAGFDYVNMQDVLDGHAQCDPDPAINGLRWISPNQGIKAPESYHPNKLGQSLMADRIQKLFDKPVEPSFVIQQDQTVTRTFFVSNGDVHVVTGWPGSDVVTTLISPSGVRYTRDSHTGADHDAGPTYEWYDISSAEQGTWTAEMYGAEVAPAGEGVTFQASDDAVPNQRPTASFETSTNGSSYTFDASASSDPDGSIAEYIWDFGDGTSATGKIAQHTYSAGVHQVTLRVVDNAGGANYATGQNLLGSAGANISSALHLTNAMTIAGPVIVRGDLTCDSSAKITGDLVVIGKTTMTNTCQITGNLYSAGAVSMNAQAKVGGNVVTRGDVHLQSSNTIHGAVFTTGTVSSIDGKTKDQLRASGALGGDVNEGYSVPELQLPSATTVSEPHPVDSLRLTWSQWMNATAAANSAPKWSKGLTAQPGCVMASWGDSVNSSTVGVSRNTVVDARSSCSTASLQGMTVKLAADLTIIANGFSTINGVHFVSSDGANHRVRIVTPGTITVGSAGAVALSAGTVADLHVILDIDASGTATVEDRSTITGSFGAAALKASGTATIGQP